VGFGADEPRFAIEAREVSWCSDWRTCPKVETPKYHLGREREPRLGRFGALFVILGGKSEGWFWAKGCGFRTRRRSDTGRGEVFGLRLGRWKNAGWVGISARGLGLVRRLLGSAPTGGSGGLRVLRFLILDSPEFGVEGLGPDGCSSRREVDWEARLERLWSAAGWTITARSSDGSEARGFKVFRFLS
jgi:hypothetical protein